MNRMKNCTSWLRGAENIMINYETPMIGNYKNSINDQEFNRFVENCCKDLAVMADDMCTISIRKCYRVNKLRVGLETYFRSPKGRGSK